MIQNLQTHTWLVIVGFGCKLIHSKFSIVGFGRAGSHSWFSTVEMGNTILHSRLFFMWDLEVHHLASVYYRGFLKPMASTAALYSGISYFSISWYYLLVLLYLSGIILSVWMVIFAQFHMLSIFSYILFMQCGFYLI